METTSTFSSSPTTKTINFAWSNARLPGGRSLDDCRNVSDTSCTGGLVAFQAMLRYYTNSTSTMRVNNATTGEEANKAEEGEASLLLNLLEWDSAFTKMHPLGRGVNRLLLQDRFGYDSYWAYSSLLKDPNSMGNEDLKNLQSESFRPVFGNLVVSTSNKWSPYIDHVHMDEATRLAIIPVFQSYSEVDGKLSRVDHIKTITTMLDYIHTINQEIMGCTDSISFYQNYTSSQRQQEQLAEPGSGSLCWIPAVVYEASGTEEEFRDFLSVLAGYTNPPAIVFQSRASETTAYQYHQVQAAVDDESSSGIRDDSTTIFVLRWGRWNRGYHHHRIIVDPLNRNKVINATIVEDSLYTIPDYIKDEQYEEDLKFMRKLIDEATQNDPVEGNSEYMPSANYGNSELGEHFRPCMGGECPIGNLFADGIRWGADADFAFVNSGGIRGDGWEAGPVHISNLWEALPFGDKLCTGTMTGLSVFRLFNHSTSMATFQTEYTEFGDRLLQVSGARVTYNTDLEDSRLLGIDIMNRTSGQYEPIQRFALYKFATDNWMCSGFDVYPELLGSELLVIDGEQPGKITESDSVHDLVGEFLGQLDDPYDTTVQGRLVNDTDSLEILDWIQSTEDCQTGSYWGNDFLTCFVCPELSDVKFLTPDGLSYDGEAGSTETFPSMVELINGEEVPVTVSISSYPSSWIIVQGISHDISQQVTLEPKERLALEIVATAQDLEAGTASGVVSISVQDGGEYPGCQGVDATLEVFMRANEAPEWVKTGPIRWAGISMMILVIALALLFAGIVYTHRKKRYVKTMQPPFLMHICGGIVVIALAIVPLSIRDSIDHPAGRDRACMAEAWLLSMGFTVVMSALFSKLWRINKVFGASRFQRIVVSVNEALVAFVSLLTINALLLLLWNLIDPLQYKILSVGGEDAHKLYGSCTSSETSGKVLFGLTLGFNGLCLLIVCYQAYKARKISSDFSESPGLGLAVFMWFQIVIIGLPVLFLIEHDNPNGLYFVRTAMIVSMCLTMLLCIFVPLLRRGRKPAQKTEIVRSTFSASNISSEVSTSKQTFDFTKRTSYDTSKRNSFGAKCIVVDNEKLKILLENHCDEGVAEQVLNDLREDTETGRNERMVVSSTDE